MGSSGARLLTKGAAAVRKGPNSAKKPAGAGARAEIATKVQLAARQTGTDAEKKASERWEAYVQNAAADYTHWNDRSKSALRNLVKKYSFDVSLDVKESVAKASAGSARTIPEKDRNLKRIRAAT